MLMIGTIYLHDVGGPCNKLMRATVATMVSDRNEYQFAQD